MKSVYVIMKQADMPDCIVIPYPHEVCSSLKVAKERTEELNKKARRSNYFLRKTKFVE